MAFWKGYRNVLCLGLQRKTSKQQHVWFHLANLLLTVCLYFSRRQGEFKCKAAEKSTGRNMSLKPLQASGIINGMNLKSKCMWGLITSFFGGSYFQLPTLECGCERVQWCSLLSLLIRSYSFQRLNIEESSRGLRVDPSTPVMATLHLTLQVIFHWDLVCGEGLESFQSGVCWFDLLPCIEK